MSTEGIRAQQASRMLSEMQVLAGKHGFALALVVAARMDTEGELMTVSPLQPEDALEAALEAVKAINGSVPRQVLALALAPR